MVLRCTDRNKACKAHIASPTPLSINKTTTKNSCSVFPDVECKEDEPKERSGEKKNPRRKLEHIQVIKVMKKLQRKSNMVSLQAYKIPKKKENSLTLIPMFTKTKLHALGATHQTPEGAIYNAV